VLLNLNSLFSSDSGTKREVLQVSSNSDSGGVDHGVLINRELRAVELFVVHIRMMNVSFAVTMVVLNDLVEKGSEGIVSIVTSCINSDS